MREHISTNTRPLRTNPDDTWLRIVGVPLAVLPFVYFYVREYGFAWELVLLTFGWGVVSTASTWQLLRWWVFSVRARYAHKDQTRRRVLLTFGGYTVLTILAQPLETWGLSQIDPTGLIGTPEFPRVYLIHIGMALAFANIVGGYYEISYYLNLYRLALTEAEALKKAQVQRQLDNLKNQVNPHFLFNSLNCLSALVRENPRAASEFLNELATVYRYLLQSNANPLVPLRAELSRLLPPLTLQVLVENAIKHNVVAADQPLHITIETSTEPTDTAKDNGDYLRVVNNLQRRPARVLSNGVGLTNIAMKYQLLGKEGIRVEQRNGQFTVSLPLLTRQLATDPEL